MTNILSEKAIEDILASDKFILSEILSVNVSDLSLVARQKTVHSGKLDLLCLCKHEILLIELKVVFFYKEIIDQINGYEKDLLDLQDQHRLIRSPIRKIILVVGATERDFALCQESGIELLVYKPEFVLSRYYENFKELSEFLKIKSGDFGVVRLGLLKSTLAHLAQGLNLKQIGTLEKKSLKTIGNRISVARHLGLASRFKNNYFLTDMGNAFLELGEAVVDDRLSERQVGLLAAFVNQNPFFSSITYTIYSLVESVFVLSKTAYPVPRAALRDYFVKSVGKSETWRMPRARETATYIFSNYACELDYLVKVNNEFYLTPAGIQAVLLMQLNRSIKLIESRK